MVEGIAPFSIRAQLNQINPLTRTVTCKVEAVRSFSPRSSPKKPIAQLGALNNVMFGTIGRTVFSYIDCYQLGDLFGILCTQPSCSLLQPLFHIPCLINHPHYPQNLDQLRLLACTCYSRLGNLPMMLYS